MLTTHGAAALVVSAMLLCLLGVASGDVYHNAASIQQFGIKGPFLTRCAVVWYTGEGRAELQRPTDSD